MFLDKIFKSSLEREPKASLIIDAARHSFKGDKLPDGRVPLTAKGLEEAARVGEAGGHAEAIKEKAARGEKFEVYGSPLERTEQSSAMRMLGEQFKDLKFDNVDPEDVMRWLETGGVKKQESELLNFQLGDGEFNKELMDSFTKEKTYLKWLAERSNEAAIEYKQKADKVTPLDIQAGNVASFFWALGRMKTEELVKNPNGKHDLAFATSHGGVLESFLYKVLDGKDKEAAKKLVEDRPNGFNENEGFKVKFNLLGEGVEDFNLEVQYDGKIYVVEAKEVIKLMQDGIDLKAKLEQA